MKNKTIESVENRWDILYRDYPEVYDEFASVTYNPDWIDVIRKRFDIDDKIVLDIGSGSGLSTFPLAKHAKKVIGIEPEDAMRKIATQYANKNKIENVEFVKRTAEKIPTKNNSADIVMGVTVASFYDTENIKKFVKESKRVLKEGGSIISIDIAPKWYGGELAPIILGKSRTTEIDACGVLNRTFNKLGFDYRDYYSIQDYKTAKKMVRSYGFIFGKKVIKYIKKHKITKVKWKFRIHYKKV